MLPNKILQIITSTAHTSHNANKTSINKVTEGDKTSRTRTQTPYNLINCFGQKHNPEWLIEQGLASHQTYYRSYRGRFLQVI